MSGEKHFIQVVTQEKSRDEDYRSSLTCRASDGTRWELRGYGKTVVEATADAWASFKCSEDEWGLHGYPLEKITHWMPLPEPPSIVGGVDPFELDLLTKV